MAAKSETSSGAITTIGLVIVIILALANLWLGLVALLVLIAMLVLFILPRECAHCGMSLRGHTAYRWSIGGVKLKVCKHCNSAFEKKKSRHPDDDSLQKLA